MKRRTRVAIVILGVVLIALALPAWFAYGPSPRPGGASSIPDRSVVLALGFTHLGEGEDGRLTPGDANRFLAAWLDGHAASIRVVLTQKAISDALPDPTRLSNGTPVLQMHEHRRDYPVRTLEALQLAVSRFAKRPDRLVLLAHGKQIARAKADLQAICPDAEIIVPDIGPVPYWDSNRLDPLSWACYELYVARPADVVRRRLPIRYPKQVELPRINLDELDAAR